MTTLNSLPPSDSSDLPPRRQPVLAAMAVTLVLAISILGLLLYRSWKSPEPSRVLVVRGDSDWDGVELTVEGGSLTQPDVTHIEQVGNYTIPFFLAPGKYTLHVKSDGVEIFKRDVDLTTDATTEIDLAHSGATTHPATQPATTSAS